MTFTSEAVRSARQAARSSGIPMRPTDASEMLRQAQAIEREAKLISKRLPHLSGQEFRKVLQRAVACDGEWDWYSEVDLSHALDALGLPPNMAVQPDDNPYCPECGHNEYSDSSGNLLFYDELLGSTPPRVTGYSPIRIIPPFKCRRCGHERSRVPS